MKTLISKLKYMKLRLTSPSRYGIKKGYVHRSSVPHFDDSPYKDEYQDKVYKEAYEILRIQNYRSVLDIGCGSAYKLIKYFDGVSFVGVEIEPTLTFLKNKYSNKEFSNLVEVSSRKFDLVICSDVIEHIERPDLFLENISQLDFDTLVISTPAREFLSEKSQNGPPSNSHHFREWTTEEFREFLSSYFLIQTSTLIEPEDATLLVVCKKKK